MTPKKTCECGCGRELPTRNGIVLAKKHPNCKLKELMRGNNGRVATKGIKAKYEAKKTPRQRAMDRADDWFSRFIRLKYAIVYSFDTAVCQCYTCGNRKAIKNIQNGHWQRRGYKATRFHEDNARPQCYKCNMKESGKPELFEINLIKEIGQENVDELKRMAQAGGEDNEIFYRAIADKYRALTNKLLKEKEIKKWW